MEISNIDYDGIRKILISSEKKKISVYKNDVMEMEFLNHFYAYLFLLQNKIMVCLKFSI